MFNFQGSHLGNQPVWNTIIGFQLHFENEALTLRQLNYEGYHTEYDSHEIQDPHLSALFKYPEFLNVLSFSIPSVNIDLSQSEIYQRFKWTTTSVATITCQSTPGEEYHQTVPLCLICHVQAFQVKELKRAHLLWWCFFHPGKEKGCSPGRTPGLLYPLLELARSKSDCSSDSRAQWESPWTKWCSSPWTSQRGKPWASPAKCWASPRRAQTLQRSAALEWSGLC